MNSASVGVNVEHLLLFNSVFVRMLLIYIENGKQIHYVEDETAAFCLLFVL